MASRWTHDQLELINSPKDMVEVAKWVLTNKRPRPAARRVLKFAGLKPQRRPHDVMIKYIGECISVAGDWPWGEYSPNNELLCQLLDEYIAYRKHHS